MRLFKKKENIIVLILIIFLVSLALLAPLITPYNPIKQNLSEAMKKPFSEGHFLGTDELGRDMLSRIVFGARITIGLSVLVVALAMFFGTSVGMISAYFGGILDNILMRIVDLLMAFPCMILGIAIVSILGPGLRSAAIAVAIYNIPIFARISRIEVLNIVTSEYIETAKTFGINDFAIILTHILPNIISPIIILGTLSAGNAVIIIASLGFLGLGAQPPIPEWGAMLSSGRHFIILAPHIVLIPGLFLFLLVYSLNILGDSVRDLLDPKLHY